MSRIAIIDPSGEHRELVSSIVGYLGHEAVIPGGTADLYDVGLIIVDPATELARLVALTIRGRTPLASVICVSVYPRADCSCEEFEPLRYLEKPFGISELEQAIHDAFAEAA